MDQVLEFFQKLFDTSDWQPRWQSEAWTSFHGWLYILSDLLIWSAFFLISIAVFRYVSRRIDSRFKKTYLLFAALILACGLVHLSDNISFWFPAYRLNALIRFITGVISWVTVFHLMRFIPTTTSLRTHADLEREVKERKRVEEELKIINQHLNVAQGIARIGHWEWDVPANKVTWSRGMYNVYGLKEGTELSYETYLERIHPEDREFVNEKIQQAYQTKSFPDFTHRIETPDGEERIIRSRGNVITDGEGQIVKMIGTGQDITDQQIAQQKIVERTHELENTNAELQKFAYVASHDLQEPLRKIMTFASLLEKEAAGNLSEAGKMYTEKIVQSSGRMQRLIDDILQFSSLKASKTDYEETDLNLVVKQVLSDMEVKLESTSAVIEVDELPVVEAIPSQIGQLFQNLVSNALKFRKDDTVPHVQIRSEILNADQLANYSWIDKKNLTRAGYSYNWSREQFVQLDVKDNGIGFDEPYAEKIFEIFQRLHTVRVYEGTGIGLAICKKIVDNHHGTISAEGKPGEGATFTIILPLSQKNFFVE
jgi:PAS domain S-box-containing protein